MQKRPNDRTILFGDIAFGERDANELQIRNEGELNRLDQLKSLVNFYRENTFKVPESAILAAINLMPESKRITLQRPSQLSLGGARDASQEHHFVFSQEGVNLRILYLPNEKGFQILGQVSPQKWIVTSENDSVETSEEGKFTLQVAGLEHEPLILLGDSATIEVSSAGAIYGSVT